MAAPQVGFKVGSALFPTVKYHFSDAILVLKVATPTETALV